MRSAWQQRRRCRKALDRCQQQALGVWLERCATMKIGTLVDTPIISVDLELTGLDPNQCQILSVGWTEVVSGRILMASNQHVLIRPEGGVGDSAAIHELRDQDVVDGGNLGDALETLFSAATDHLFLFHHAGLDVAFLQRACEQWAGCRPPIPALDTLQLEATRRRRRGQPIPDGALRLGALRSAYDLPGHTLHDALGDAVATAELFLAMASHAGGKDALSLAPYVRWL